MNLKQFILLNEGGNVSFGKYSAETLDLTQVERDTLVPLLKELLKKVALKFKQLEKEELWTSDVLEQNKFLSGSAKHLFDLENIPSNEFKKFKPLVGDIDLKVNQKHRQLVKDFLSKIKKDPVAVEDISLTLIDFKESNFQYITLWTLKSKEHQYNLQLDWQLVEFDKNNKPSEFAEFFHSSHWTDLTNKIKGVFHKLLLRAITSANTWTVRIKTRNGVSDRVTEKTYSISTKGLRPTFEIIDTDNSGLPIVKKLNSATADYEQDLSIIFTKLFVNVKTPISKTKLKKLDSFVGLVELIKTYHTEQQQTILAKRFIDLVYDTTRYPLYVRDFSRDRIEKETAINYLINHLDKPIQQDLTAYSLDQQSIYEEKLYPSDLNTRQEHS